MGVSVKYSGSRELGRRLRSAEILCEKRQARLTPLRREVLELVLSRGRPVGAYELLAELKALGYGGGPPTVYRALDFLQLQGLVHRLASANAYVACAHPGDDHMGLIFVCGSCGETVEIEECSISGDLGRRARRLGFELPPRPVEVVGTCRRCRRSERS